MTLRAGTRSILAIAAALGTWPSPVSAGTIVTVSVVCPVCDHAFESLVLRSSDRRGGIDRDLFARAITAQDVHYLITSCTRCFYSGYLDDFQPGRIDASLREKILQSPRLKPITPISARMKQDEIPVATRYALAATVYEWRGSSHEARAWLHLRWAWAVREDGSYLPPTPDMIQAMREIEPRLPPARAGRNQADRELQAAALLAADWMEGFFDPPREPYVRLVLALVLRRHGENAAARMLADPVAALPDLAEPLRSAVRNMIASIDEESRLLVIARRHFEQAVARDQVGRTNRSAARYLLGEISRRLDDREAAQHWYELAMEQPDLDSELREWIQQQRDLLEPVPGLSTEGRPQPPSTDER